MSEHEREGEGGHDAAGEREGRFGGLREPTPEGLPWLAATGIALWRASIIVVPILCIVAGLGSMRIAEDVATAFDPGEIDPWMVFFSFGLILVLYAFLAFFAALAAMAAMALGIVSVVLAFPLALALDASLKKALRGSDTRLPYTLLAIGILGILAMPLLAGAFPPFGYLALLPLVAFVMLAMGQDDLRAAVRPRAKAAARPAGACAQCGAVSQAGARFCASCGAALAPAPAVPAAGSP